MRQPLNFVIGLAIVWVLAAGIAFAQPPGDPGAGPAPAGATPAPAATTPAPAAASGPSDGWGGSGFYCDLTKLFGSLFFFLIWIYTTDWVSRDVQQQKLPVMMWNPLVFGTFVAAFVAMWLIPIFLVGFPLLIIAYAAPLSVYVVHRNKLVHKEDKVLTSKHIKGWLVSRVSKKQVVEEDVDPHTLGPPVILTARGDDQQANNVNQVTARAHGGFLEARKIIASGLERRADAIMLDYAQETVNVRFFIDGVWHQGEPLEREPSDAGLAALKTLCGLNAEDRKVRQEGVFMAEFNSVKMDCDLATQGTQAGERVVIKTAGEETSFNRPADLGMRSKIEERIYEAIDAKKGFVLFSAMPAAGLGSTLNVMLRGTDRFIREFMAFEEESSPYERVENVMINTYNAAKGDDMLEHLSRFFLQEPNVAIIRDLVSGEQLSMICEEIDSERVVIGTVRAKDSAEALLRVLALKVPPQEFASKITAVINQRLVRRLCEACKEAYAPPPNVLQQLGIPAGRIQAFYRPPSPPAEGEKQEICKECGGLGYFGRTAIFEFLPVGDSVRQVLTTTPKLDLLRQAARKDGMQSLQQEGIVLVAKGVTSLAELMRVMKQ